MSATFAGICIHQCAFAGAYSGTAQGDCSAGLLCCDHIGMPDGEVHAKYVCAAPDATTHRCRIMPK